MSHQLDLRMTSMSSALWRSKIGFACFLTTFIIVVLQDVSCSRNTIIKTNGTMEIDKYFSMSCSINFESVLWWAKGGENVTKQNTTKSASGKATSVILEFKKLAWTDLGDYTCFAAPDLNETIQVGVEVQINSSQSEVVKSGSNVSLSCEVHGFPLENTTFQWSFPDSTTLSSSSHPIRNFFSSTTARKSAVDITGTTKEHNGTYECRFGDSVSKIDLTVQSLPHVTIGVIKSVGRSSIFFNWTIFDGNTRITAFNLTYHTPGSSATVQIEPSKNWFILENLDADTLYGNFTFTVVNLVGKSVINSTIELYTLRADPAFVPVITVKGSGTDSVTLGWAISEPMSEFYHEYEVVVQTKEGYNTSYRTDEDFYMIARLEPGTSYLFKVRACSNYTRQCDSFSNEERATTMEGLASEPRNLSVKCLLNHTNHQSVVSVKWDSPAKPRGNITEYFVTLYGNATYLDTGRQSVKEVGPIDKTVIKTTQVEFTGQPPNTKIYVRVCAKTRSKLCGNVAEGQCFMPPSIPNKDELSKANWRVVHMNSKMYFMVSLPNISQQNGTICCFRVIVVRLPKMQAFNGLQPPNELKLSSYAEVHNSSVVGAYVAEIMDPNSRQVRNIIIGDGRNDTQIPCQQCLFPAITENLAQGVHGNYRRPLNFHKETLKPSKVHRKRHANANNPGFPVHDGPLDADSIYTAYLDALVISDTKGELWAQSKYFDPLRPMGSTEGVWPALIGGLVLAVLVVILAAMCVLRWRRKEPGDEEYGLSHSLQQLCRRLRGQQWVPSEPTIDLPSIPVDQIIPVFVKRHKDADYEFQQEFENLPERFSDRTFHESDKRDNVGKNRYPDIKAYDQTRVRLTPIEGVASSDYINANFVVGYKERKKFICAQGPMESTVNDWWRMIWEQRVCLILMLTNTEEYNKTKCAKYWPSEGSSVFGDITVTNSSEKRFSDYLVRDLKLKKNRQSENGELIDEREVQQYHYLVWKDFMAPEHPVGIIRFIKRFNEIYSLEKGPILAHCSAGVGRTGTLVALDSLLEQLNEEKCVSIFNTICDLRHQRNYLVQSLKQYIFIYRALMEFVQFGDTEISLSSLKSSLEKLNVSSEGESLSRMQQEFEKFSHVIEDRKAISVGTSDENRHRNRHEHVIPYDRSRVILSPIPSLNKDICTYINASFIEGYDNGEEYIMAQDPLPTTVGDFWRMTVEQNVRTIVMLSEVADDKCPRYWPEKDQETTHDYIRVKYMQSQSFPFYYKREFTVTNIKSDDSCLITQFQYNGWPVGDDEVPESSRGLVELIDTTLKHQETQESNVGSTVVHCSDGAQRSCIFVALAILARQLLRESRVDVFSVVRKLRSQRQGLFQNFAQYDLVYRGLLTYAELHMSNGVEDFKF